MDSVIGAPSRFRALLFGATVVGLAAMARGQDDGKLTVTVFTDYYFVSDHHDPMVDGSSGFWFRRIYLTYDKKLAEGFAARIRLEAASAGDFTSSTTLTTKYKDVYLSHTGGGRTVYFGLTPTPAILNYEGFHPGYRVVEKTPLDLYKLATTRDTGIGLKGNVGDGRTGYWIMVGNDSGTSAETNKGKAFYGTLNHRISDRLFVEGNFIYADKAGSDHWTTVSGFLGYKGARVDASVFYARQTRSLAGVPDVELGVLSLFIGGQASKDVRPFFRVDILDGPVPGGDTISYLKLATTATPTVFIGGVDLTLSENVHLIPNFELVTYRDPVVGPTPSDDVFFRLTVHFRF